MEKKLGEAILSVVKYLVAFYEFMTDGIKRAAQLHKDVPPDWYVRSIRENLLQRFWHTTRFKEIGRLITPSGGRILDIGCADGTFTKVILEKSLARKIIAIDALASSIAYATRRFARSKKLSFRVADAHNLPFKDKEFDAIFCLETMEHVEDPKKVISEIHRVLKDGGHAIVLVPSENWLFRFIVWPLWKLWRGRIWKDTHLHRFSADRLVHLMEKDGFKITKNHKFLLGMLQVIKAIKQ